MTSSKEKRTTFGAIENAMCVARARIAVPVDYAKAQGATHLLQAPATGIVDTGCQKTTILWAFAKSLGLPMIDCEGRVGVDGVVKRRPVVVGSLLLPSLDGGTYYIDQEFLVEGGLPKGIQFLLGMNTLSGGILTVNSIGGDWEWEVAKCVSRVRDGWEARATPLGELVSGDESES